MNSKGRKADITLPPNTYSPTASAGTAATMPMLVSQTAVNIPFSQGGLQPAQFQHWSLVAERQMFENYLFYSEVTSLFSIRFRITAYHSPETNASIERLTQC